MLTDAELDHIVKLARLEIAPETREHMKRDLSSILSYIDQLNSIDTSSVDPLFQVMGLENKLREDGTERSFEMNAELSRLLIDEAPAHDGRYLKVRNIKNS
jgi:aspartyl-tRNA(Asn)/glutamyl-tRNA(Gln) amidotransferase subunit C